jgi:hypothetical protein
MVFFPFGMGLRRRRWGCLFDAGESDGVDDLLAEGGEEDQDRQG